MLTTLSILLFTTLSCVGLLAAWAATSPRHWFLRTAVFLGTMALLLLIPAHEPFVVFVLQAATIVAGVQTSRWWRRRKCDELQPTQQFRFSLMTLLLIMVLVAVGTTIGVRMPEQGFRGWQSIVLDGVAAGAATLVGLWIVYGRLVRWWVRVAMGTIVALVFSLPVMWCDWFVYGVTFYSWPPPDPSQDQSLAFISAFSGKDSYKSVWISVLVGASWVTCCVIWLWVGILSGRAAAAEPRRFVGQWRRVLAGATLLGMGILLVTPPADVYYRLMTPLPIPEVTMPDPNGYDDIIAAGELAESLNFGNINQDFDTVPQKQLAAALKTLLPAFERLHTGLSKPIRVPVDYTSDELIEMHSFQANRGLARAISGRGRLAKLEGRNRDAAESFLENIRFGYAIRRDAMMIDSLVGNAISGVGASGLFDIRARISAEQCAAIIDTLIELEQQAESDEDVIYRDRIWSQYAFGWAGHLTQILDDLTPNDTLFNIDSFIQACNRDRAVMRLLRVELAMQSWRENQGELPESLEDLVPRILPAVPVDPFDAEGSPLRYRRTEDGYVLYSVGTDGEDDGGIPDSEDIASMWFMEDGDLRLDLLYADEPAETDEEDGDEDGDEAYEDAVRQLGEEE